MKANFLHSLWLASGSGQSDTNTLPGYFKRLYAPPRLAVPITPPCKQHIQFPDGSSWYRSHTRTLVLCDTPAPCSTETILGAWSCSEQTPLNECHQVSDGTPYSETGVYVHMSVDQSMFHLYYLHHVFHFVSRRSKRKHTSDIAV